MTQPPTGAVTFLFTDLETSIVPPNGNAVRTALNAQGALHAHAWTAGTELRLRMGLHTREATPAAGG